MKTVKVILIALAAFGPLLIGMAVEPSAFIQTSKISWLVVRAVVFVSAIVLALLTYYGTGMAAARKEFLDDLKNFGKDYQQSANLPDFLNNVRLLVWVFWWIICFQIMASFYIADWCINGF
jgi:hypothetical protein